MNSYARTTWKNLSSPAINDIHLNKIEEGIYDATNQVIQNTGDILLLTQHKDNSTYDFGKVGIYDGGAIVIKADTYQPVVDLTVANRQAGTYQITFSITFKYSVVNKSALFRWTIDGGSVWKEISHEQKDTTNDEIITYTFPKILTGGAIDFKIEAKCENAANTLTIDFANIILERKI